MLITDTEHAGSRVLCVSFIWIISFTLIATSTDWCIIPILQIGKLICPFIYSSNTCQPPTMYQMTFLEAVGTAVNKTNQIPAYLRETDDKYTSNISGGKCYGEKLSRAMGLGGMGRRLYECVIE